MTSIAFRNIGRNKKRTLILVISVAIITVILSALSIVMGSFLDTACENTITFESGDIRVRNKRYAEYEDIMPLSFFVENKEELKEKILSVPGVEKVNAMTAVPASLYLDGEMKNITIYGVEDDSFYMDPDIARIDSGSMIGGEGRVALATAKFLDIFGKDIGDRVTVISRTTSGTTNGMTYTIEGGVWYNYSELKSENLFVPLSTLSSQMHMDGGALELLVYTDGSSEPETVAERISEVLGDDYEIKTWKECSVLYDFLPIYRALYVVVAVLFYMVAGTIIFNTTAMAVIERKREVSTMVAIGFKRKSVRRIFIGEIAVTAVIGALSGGIISGILAIIFSGIGVDLSMFGADAVEGWGLSSILYVKPDIGDILLSGSIGIIASLLVALFASRRIKKVEVADALRSDE